MEMPIEVLKKMRETKDESYLEELFNNIDTSSLNDISTKESFLQYINKLKEIITIDHLYYEELKKTELYGEKIQETFDKIIDLDLDFFNDLSEYEFFLTEDNIEEIKRLLIMNDSYFYSNYSNYYFDSIINNTVDSIDDSNIDFIREYIKKKFTEIINYKDTKEAIEIFYNKNYLEPIEKDELLVKFEEYINKSLPKETNFSDEDYTGDSTSISLNEFFEDTIIDYQQKDKLIDLIRIIREQELENINIMKETLTEDNKDYYYLLFRINTTFNHSYIDNIEINEWDDPCYTRANLTNRIIREKIEELLNTREKPFVKETVND